MALRAQIIRRLIAIGVLLLFFTWTGWYVIKHYQDFSNIFQVPLLNLIVLYLFFCATMFLSGVYTRDITQAFGLRLRMADCLMLAAATTAANYMAIFRAGASVRAIYLKTRHRFAYADFISTLSAMYLMHFIINGFFGLAGLFFLVYNGLPFDLPFAVFYVVSALVSTVIMFSGFTMKPYNRFPFREISRVVNGWALIRSHPFLVFKLTANTFLCYLLLVFQTKVAFATYDVHMSWGALLFYTSGLTPVSLATITPGAIGILEGFSVYMGRVLNYTTADALQVQALIRFVAITSLLILGPWAFSRMGMSAPIKHE